MRLFFPAGGSTYHRAVGISANTGGIHLQTQILRLGFYYFRIVVLQFKVLPPAGKNSLIQIHSLNAKLSMGESL